MYKKKKKTNLQAENTENKVEDTQEDGPEILQEDPNVQVAEEYQNLYKDYVEYEKYENRDNPSEYKAIVELANDTIKGNMQEGNPSVNYSLLAFAIKVHLAKLSIGSNERTIVYKNSVKLLDKYIPSIVDENYTDGLLDYYSSDMNLYTLPSNSNFSPKIIHLKGVPTIRTPNELYDQPWEQYDHGQYDMVDSEGTPWILEYIGFDGWINNSINSAEIQVWALPVGFYDINNRLVLYAISGPGLVNDDLLPEQ